MSKNTKTVLVIIAVMSGFLLLLYFGMNLIMKNLEEKTVTAAEYKSEDGAYTLLFQQVGETDYSDSEIHVRFVVKDKNEKILASEDRRIRDAQNAAAASQIESVTFEDHLVIVVIAPSISDRLTIKISY